MSTITNTDNPTLSRQIPYQATAKITKIADKLEELIDARRKVEKFESDLKGELKDLLKPSYFKYNANVEDAGDAQHTFDLRDLQINFVNSYFIKDSQHAQELVKLLGANHPLTQHIKESAKITLDVTSLDPADANDLARTVTEEAVGYGIRPHVERKAVVSEEFHGLRHVYLTPEDNLTLDKTLPIQIQVARIE